MKIPNNHPAVLCLEDEPAVLDAVVRDLAQFEEDFRIEPAASVEEARQILADLHEKKIPLALALCDHLLPGVTGTDFLVELKNKPETRKTRKVLITAQAGLEETVRAVNEAGLNHYIAKPWNAVELQTVVRDELTTYVLESGLNPLPFLHILNTTPLAEAIAAGSFFNSDT